MDKLKAGRPTIEFMKYCYQSGRPPLIIGAHGIGKSELLEKSAMELGIGFISRDLSLMEAPDLVGLPKITRNKTRYMPPEFLPTSGKGILVLEELNRCERYVRAPCLQLLTSRTLNDYRLPEGWLPAAVINPTGGEYEVFDLDSALVSRFVTVNLVPDPKEWLMWARNNGIHPSVITYVEDDGSIFDDPQSNPRAWKYVSDFLHETDKNPTKPAYLRAAVRGLVGNKRGTAFLKTLKNIDKPLRPAMILSSYSRYQDKVRNWTEAGKLDLLKSTMLAILKHLQPKAQFEAVKTDAKKWSRLARFFGDLPPDLRAPAEEFFEERDYQYPKSRRPSRRPK